MTQDETCSDEVGVTPHRPEMQLRILKCILSAKGRKKVA